MIYKVASETIYEKGSREVVRKELGILGRTEYVYIYISLVCVKSLNKHAV